MTVSIQNLRFSYAPQRAPETLAIADWFIGKGDWVLVYGPSGSGKSTLLNLLAGVLVASQGAISVMGKSLSAMGGRQRDRFRATHIGVVFQQFNLISYLPVLDNIRLAAYFGKTPARTFDQRANRLLRALQIDPALEKRTAGQLSVGQQQRVAIARALISAPELLIVDEPTSALDDTSRDAFMALLLQLIEEGGTTLVFVSHDRDLAGTFSDCVALSSLNSVGAQS